MLLQPLGDDPLIRTLICSYCFTEQGFIHVQLSGPYAFTNLVHNILCCGVLR